LIAPRGQLALGSGLSEPEITASGAILLLPETTSLVDPIVVCRSGGDAALRQMQQRCYIIGNCCITKCPKPTPN
jgi:hypothetical protein